MPDCASGHRALPVPGHSTSTEPVALSHESMLNACAAGHSNVCGLQCCQSITTKALPCMLTMQATVRDLHQAKDVGTFSSSFSGLVMPRDVLPLRISPTSGPSAQGSREGSLQGTGSAGRSVSDDGWRPWHGNEYIQRHAKRRSSGEVEAAVRASRAARMRRAVEGAAASVY